MAKVCVNLRLLHDEYKSKCSREHMVAMGYTRFCERYGDYTAANSLTKRIEHKAGVSCEVDWSGPTVGRGLVNPVTGEASKIYLFVGVLPFSQKAYFEPTLDMRQRTWLRCHAAPGKTSWIARLRPSWASLVTQMTPSTPRARSDSRNDLQLS